MKLFLASHGKMASGIKTSLEILAGNVDKLTVFDAYVDERQLADVLDDFYSRVEDDEQVVLLSDLYGGSVNTQMVPYTEKKNTFLVAGVNLAFVLEMMMKDTITADELEEVAQQSRSMLQVVKLDSIDTSDDDFL